mmetsp:Transcript_23225/g.65791  ORF Transcript_23225/g.65791 Transcript_23225/m.65791 type:complete len:205 (+) Transcript_23225:805-1419(+)
MWLLVFVDLVGGRFLVLFFGILDDGVGALIPHGGLLLRIVVGVDGGLWFETWRLDDLLLFFLFFGGLLLRWLRHLDAEVPRRPAALELRKARLFSRGCFIGLHLHFFLLGCRLKSADVLELLLQTADLLVLADDHALMDSRLGDRGEFDVLVIRLGFRCGVGVSCAVKGASALESAWWIDDARICRPLDGLEQVVARRRVQAVR